MEPLNTIPSRGKSSQKVCDCNGTLELSLGADTDVGGRLRNEDFCLVTETFSCVSDGIGGAEYGDVMSKLACTSAREEWEALDSTNMAPEERMRTTLVNVDRFLTKVGKRLGRGPGATIVVSARIGDSLVFGTVGDSRAFLLTDKGFSSVFQDTGRVWGKENELSVALGYGMLAKDRTKANVSTIRGVAGMKFLLCTDGVWATLSESVLREAMLEGDHPWSIAHSLIGRAACAAGANEDNATALVGIMRAVYEPTDTTPLARATRGVKTS